MATSSFTKTFVLDSNASKKVIEIQKSQGVRVPASSPDRIKEGKEALARFSARSKR